MRNPKTRKYSKEFVVENNLTPLIGARAAQQMGLLTVHDENFITASPLPKENELQVRRSNKAILRCIWPVRWEPFPVKST